MEKSCESSREALRVHLSFLAADSVAIKDVGRSAPRHFVRHRPRGIPPRPVGRSLGSSGNWKSLGVNVPVKSIRYFRNEIR